MANSRFGLRTRRGGVSGIIKGVVGLPSGFDPDALAYIQAVQFADAQNLETEVQNAINEFVLGCKQDGIWDAIKASCILAGARTLTGALVPLKGTAPTSFNFVSGDYDRKTGLVGNGTNKYISSNRNNNADPQDNNHNAVYITTLGTGFLIATTSSVATNGANAISNINFRNRNVNAGGTFTSTTIGLRAASRALSTEYTYRINGNNGVIVQTSQTPSNSIMNVFSAIGNANQYSTNRIAFYSIGEALDLALLDSRIATLLNEYDAAI
jgi:hypothetical protein